MGGAAIAPPTSLVEKDKERKYTRILFSETWLCLFLAQPSVVLMFFPYNSLAEELVPVLCSWGKLWGS